MCRSLCIGGESAGAAAGYAMRYHAWASGRLRCCNLSNSSMHASAAIDAPEGFLYEWWGVFWEIFVAKTKPAASPAAASYLEACLDLLLQLVCGRGAGACRLIES